MAIGSMIVVLYRLRLSAAPVTRMAVHSEKAISAGMHTRTKWQGIPSQPAGMPGCERPV